MKIAVIGYSGTGKSTLAKFLAEHYGLPLLYLDTVQFTAGWQERDFFCWLLWKGRTPKHRAHYRDICQMYADKVVILRNRAQVKRFRAGLQP